MDGTMRDLIERLRQAAGVHVEDRAFDWLIRITSVPGFEFEVLVPYTVLEWDVTARNAATGAEVWHDWMDYTGYVPKEAENLPQLAEDMRTDVEWFLATLRRATDFRVRTERVLGILPQRAAEWLVDGEWRSTWMTPRTAKG